MNRSSEYWADKHEVLLHKRTRELKHVTERFWNVDQEPNEEYPEWGRYYRLQDDTHTTEEHWYEEDLKECFMKIGVVVSGKPLKADELEYWYD